jgi:uncharacterized membrane protein YhaH (DUF805 family)
MMLYNGANALLLSLIGVEYFTWAEWAQREPSPENIVKMFLVLSYIGAAMAVNGSLIARRLHDIGLAIGYKKGHWDPIYLILQPVILFIKKGEHAENTWGAPPRAGISWSALFCNQ